MMVNSKQLHVSASKKAIFMLYISENELYNIQCIFCLMTRSRSSYRITYN